MVAVVGFSGDWLVDTLRLRWIACAVVVLAGLVVVEAASAVGVPDYGYEWATIGEPGNRATLPNEVLRAAWLLDDGEPFPEYGAVGYVYRIRITEVSLGEWMEFVAAYMPFYIARTGNFVGEAGLTGDRIQTPFGEPRLVSWAHPDEPADMSWEYAARYCNWLHNGKVEEEWAFESGVYDTTTFVFEGRRAFHQIEPTPGALFWMPTRDEWIKAAHYDPDRYGPGREGYWTYPNRSSRRPIGGLLPEDGGERNAGPSFAADPFPLAVGSFPDQRSPWGLLDCAGGMGEWTTDNGRVCNIEDLPECHGSRLRMGSATYNYIAPHFTDYEEEDLFNADRIEFYGTSSVRTSAFDGLRLASVDSTAIDYEAPFGALDLSDLAAFVRLYLDADPRADLTQPFGSIDTHDVSAFVDRFLAGIG
jgi:hypothetical protein